MYFSFCLSDESSLKDAMSQMSSEKCLSADCRTKRGGTSSEFELGLKSSELPRRVKSLTKDDQRQERSSILRPGDQTRKLATSK